MPRYFFHFREQDEFIDREGIVLDELETARAELAIASGELLQEMGKSLRAGCILEAWVTNEEGETLCALAVQFRTPVPHSM